MLISHRPDAANIADAQGRTPLHMACSDGTIVGVQKLLQCPAVDVCATDGRNASPLHWAAVSNRPDVCQLLLQNGAVLMARDSGGQTPLHYASERGYHECVTVMQRSSASARPVSSRNPRGESRRQPTPRSHAAVAQPSGGPAVRWSRRHAAIAFASRTTALDGRPPLMPLALPCFAAAAPPPGTSLMHPMDMQRMRTAVSSVVRAMVRLSMHRAFFSPAVVSSAAPVRPSLCVPPSASFPACPSMSRLLACWPARHAARPPVALTARLL